MVEIGGRWLCFRNVTNSRASVRTLYLALLPKVGVGNSASSEFAT